MATKTTTADLRTGDRLLIDGRLVRTVREVVHSGYVNRRNLPIFAVLYEEGDTREWSGGNTGIASTL